MASTQRSEVEVRTSVPIALHKQLWHRSFDEGLTLRAAVVAAIEAWVTPAERDAQVRGQAIDQALAILDQPGLTRAETQARVAALRPTA